MKAAAIWARVSTHDQRELSLDSQIDRAKSKLESLGYSVPPDFIFTMDWASQELSSCPQFHDLCRLVKERRIEAVGVFDRDRLNAQGLERLVFLSECRQAEVQVVICQGPPILDEPEGQLVELALAIGKERSVMRAQQGARDGLRDRARLKGLPPSPRDPYGYSWAEDRKKLQPTAMWDNVAFICREALAGATLGHIRQQLHKRGIASPEGGQWWAKPVIHSVLANPVYGGRFYALRREAMKPRQRRVKADGATSYGKTGSRRKPLTEAHYLSNIVVESPPLTWEEWQSLQERLNRNKLMAQRNAKRDYLLRSVILCETHKRRYHGQPHNKSWRYTCPARQQSAAMPCSRQYLNGPELEAKIKAICRDIITKPEIIEAELAKRHNQTQDTATAIENRLKGLETKESKALDTEANLLLDRATGEASEEAYRRALARVRAEKAWISEEKERLQHQLSAAHRHEGAVIHISEAREKLCALLANGTNQDWREVFAALGLEIRVASDGVVHVGWAIPIVKPSIESYTPG